MSTPALPTTFVAAMKHFFGMLPTQTLATFGAEVKALSAEDRAYFTKHLIGAGYPIPAG